MLPLLTTLRRTLLVSTSVPVAVVAMALSWLGSYLAAQALGGDGSFVAEVRAGSVLVAGALVLSLAEPLEVAREARGGLLALRAARGGGFALTRRWLGLLLACVPTMLLAGWAGGGWPEPAVPLLLDLSVLCAGGLCLGAFLDRALLVPALWCLAILGSLHGWLADNPVAWIVPPLGALQGATGVLSALLWCGGALLIAHWRLSALVAQGD